MILKVFQAGENILRQQARALSRHEILSEPVQQLLGWMRETMRYAPGVGLAAPQVGMPLQIAVVEDRQNYIDKLPPGQAAQRKRVPIPFHVLINPSLVVEEEVVEEHVVEEHVVETRRDPSLGEVHFFEGCLSLAGFTAIVPRALAVRVECLDERGEPVSIRADGWYARILQHEIDHLHGRLYIDRMQPRSFMTLDNFNRHWKEKSVLDFWSVVGTGA
jgi:peptide deformylase